MEYDYDLFYQYNVMCPWYGDQGTCKGSNVVKFQNTTGMADEQTCQIINSRNDCTPHECPIFYWFTAMESSIGEGEMFSEAKNS